jgi:hypothetical protein
VLYLTETGILTHRQQKPYPVLNDYAVEYILEFRACIKPAETLRGSPCVLGRLLLRGPAPACSSRPPPLGTPSCRQPGLGTPTAARLQHQFIIHSKSITS